MKLFKLEKVNFNNFVKKYSLLFFFIFIFIIIYFSNISIGDILGSLRELQLNEICVLIILFLLISVNIICYKYYILLSFVYKVRIKNLSLIHFASIGAHYSAPAKLGYPTEIFLLKKFEKVPVSISTTLITIELIASMSLSASISLIGSLLYFPYYAIKIIIVLSISIITIFLFFLIMKNASRIKRKNKLINFLEEIIVSLKKIKFKTFVVLALLYLSTQILGAFSGVLLIYFLGEEIDLLKILFVNSAAFFLGSISMIPLGLGVRDGTVLFFLTNFGICQNIGLNYVAIQRIISIGLGYILGFLSGGVLGVKNIIKKKNEIN